MTLPTYEYECQSCHQRVEAVQGFHDPALTTCEACGGELRKVFSAVGIVFKGSGFYKNDSRTGSKKTPTTVSSDPSPSSGSESPAPSPSPAPAPAPVTAATSSAPSTSAD